MRIRPLLLVLGLLFGAPSFSQSVSTCTRALDRLPQIHNADLLVNCLNLFYNSPTLDPDPMAFKSLIKFGYRILEIDNTRSDIYGVVAWLLWSKWRNWSTDPLNTPDGQGKEIEALALLRQGAKINRNAEYFIAAANTIWPLAQFFLPHYYIDVLHWYTQADALLSKSDKRKIRVRLNIGHIYRNTQQLERAAQAYHAVLAIDSANEVALRILRCLEQNLECAKPKPSPQSSSYAQAE